MKRYTAREREKEYTRSIQLFLCIPRRLNNSAEMLVKCFHFKYLSVIFMLINIFLFRFDSRYSLGNITGGVVPISLCQGRVLSIFLPVSMHGVHIIISYANQILLSFIATFFSTIFFFIILSIIFCIRTLIVYKTETWRNVITPTTPISFIIHRINRKGASEYSKVHTDRSRGGRGG